VRKRKDATARRARQLTLKEGQKENAPFVDNERLPALRRRRSSNHRADSVVDGRERDTLEHRSGRTEQGGVGEPGSDGRVNTANEE
jgi:hypothetical protein